jgi:hypothetical protein
MMRAATFTLRIESDTPITLTMSDGEQVRLQRALTHAQDIINDFLPEGFYCKIDESGEGVDLAAVERLEQMGGGA